MGDCPSTASSLSRIATAFARPLCGPIDMSRQRFSRSAAHIGKRIGRRCYVFLFGVIGGRDYRVVRHGVGIVLASTYLEYHPNAVALGQKVLSCKHSSKIIRKKMCRL